MKKKYLTWAGIVAAGLLAILFASILLTGTFTLFPSASIDPIADRNAGDLMVITGTTNLPVGAELEIGIFPASGADPAPLPGQMQSLSGVPV